MSFLSPRKKNVAKRIVKKYVALGRQKADILNRDRLENGNFRKDVVGAEALKKGLLGGHPPIYHLPLPPRRFARGNMAYRSIDDTFWLSPKVRQLSQEAKLLYIYLISVGGTTGLVHSTPEIMAATLGASHGRLRALLKELHEKERIIWLQAENQVLVIGQIEHQSLVKGNIDFYKVKHVKKAVDNMPEGIAKQEITDKYGERLETLLENLPQRKPKRPSRGVGRPSSNESERESENEIKKKEEMVGAKPTSTFQSLTTQIFESWKAKTGQPPNWGQAEGQLLKQLLGRFNQSDIFDCWQSYLNNPDWFAKQNGQSFRNFYASFDKVISRNAQSGSSVLDEWVKQKKAEAV